MGLPCFNKKEEPVSEKKDLKQNYTTDDHKTDLGELLSGFGTDANKVSSRYVVTLEALPSPVLCTLPPLVRLLLLLLVA